MKACFSGWPHRVLLPLLRRPLLIEGRPYRLFLLSSLCVFALPVASFCLLFCTAATSVRPACASPAPSVLSCTADLLRAVALRPGTGHIATTVPELRKALCDGRGGQRAELFAVRGAEARQNCFRAATRRRRKICGARIVISVSVVRFGMAVALRGLPQATRRCGSPSHTIHRTWSAHAVCATARSPKCLNCETVGRQGEPAVRRTEFAPLAGSRRVPGALHRRPRAGSVMSSLRKTLTL